ncbi:hypothetical protein [Streptomyces sp. NPDC001604]|uniref:hypothetical protein n=1 Tax=Streptomyces sp. NPDC001604 TaxID=3364593 RepID=UPI0036777F78
MDVPGRLDFSKDLVADIITTKLALEGSTFSWHLAGRKTYVTVKKTRKPPAKVAFKDPKVREMVAAAKESAPIIGIGSAGQIVTVDLDAESPAHPGQRRHGRRQVRDPAVHRLPDAPPRLARVRPRQHARPVPVQPGATAWL